MDHLGNPGVAQEMLCASESHDAREPLEAQTRARVSKRGDAIVAATLIVVGGPPPLRGLFDQCGAEHPLDGPIESARSHTDLPLGRFLDFLGDGVPVALAVGEGQQDVKDDRREREQAFWSASAMRRLYPLRI